MSARQVLILLVRKNQMLEPNRSDRQTAPAPWGKRTAGGSLTTVGLRPPSVSLPPTPFSSWLSLASHLDRRAALYGQAKDAAASFTDIVQRTIEQQPYTAVAVAAVVGWL